ncbi:MAG TPA: hypothetical protein DCZ41_05600 [Firmicutes bacterium]|nr:hypothetical protein [Bacillota bacterium]
MSMKERRHFTLSLLFACSLAFLGGYMEVLSVKGFGVYCAMQTGNTILTFTNLIDGKYGAALISAATLLSFVLFSFLGELWKVHHKSQRIHFSFLALGSMSCALVMAFGFSFLEEGSLRAYAVNIALAAYGATQVLAFESFNDRPFVSTMMTVLLKNFTLHLAKASKERTKDSYLSALEYLVVFISFVLGGILSYLLFRFARLGISPLFLFGVIYILLILIPLKRLELGRGF